MKRTALTISAAVLILVVTLPMLPVYAQEAAMPWQPPKSYVNPATQKIRELKAEGMTETQITAELERQGMGWDPQTGAVWKGKAINVTMPKMSLLSDSSLNASRTSSAVSLTNSYWMAWEIMKGASDLYQGCANYMSPGSIATSQGATDIHWVTMHLGREWPNGNDCWTEVGVARSFNTLYAPGPGVWYFTYDNDEGSYVIVRQKTNGNTQDQYVIMYSYWDDWGYLQGVGGWFYDTFINGEWVRGGHLWADDSGFDCADEICSFQQNSWTIDNINAHFFPVWTYDFYGQRWNPFNSNELFADNSGSFNPPPFPMMQNHYLYQNSWVFDAWTYRTD